MFRQLVGGAIGARNTGIVVRILMDRWADSFKEILARIELDIFLLKKYIDDLNLPTGIVPVGYKSIKERDGTVS